MMMTEITKAVASNEEGTLKRFTKTRKIFFALSWEKVTVNPNIFYIETPGFYFEE